MIMIRIFLLALIVLISTPTLAQSTGTSSGQEQLNIMQEIFDVSPAPVDGESNDFELQHRYLGSLLGDFIFGIWDGSYSGDENSPTPLSYAIGFVNIVAMLLGVITFLYVYLLGAVGTASDASLMGQENSATFIPLRTAIGFGLLMPVPGIGGGVFSTIQLLIVWVIVTGSNAASVMWYKTVDYIIGNPSAAFATEASANVTHPFEVAKMWACVGIYNEYRNSQGGTYFADDLISIKSSGVNSRYDTNTTPSGLQGATEDHGSTFFGLIKYKFETHNMISEEVEPSEFINKDPGITELGFQDEICGKIDLPKGQREALDSKEKVDLKKAILAIRPHVGSMIDNSMKAITNPVLTWDFNRVKEDYMRGSGDSASKIGELSENLGAIGTQYKNNIGHAIDVAYGNDSSDAYDELRETLSRGGWMKSILWFYERATFTDSKISAYQLFENITKFSGSPNLCSDVDKDDLEDEDAACLQFQAKMDLALKAINQSFIELVNTSTPGSGYDTRSSKQYANSLCGFGANCANSNRISNINSSVKDMNDTLLVSAQVLSFVSDNDVTSTQGRSNPFTVMSELGHNMNRAALVTWEAAALVKSMAYAFFRGTETTMQGTGLFGGGAVVGASALAYKMAEINVMAVIAILVGVLSNGFILAYAIPFMPILTWVAMLIGYLLMCIEAIVAAPLAVVMMFTPEGKGIVGTRLQSALNLLNACTLRPMLMTLGVLAATQLAYVAYEIFNTFFWLTAESYLHGGIFDFFAILIVYTTACYQICKIVVSAIPKLPDQIMEWMASGVGRSFNESAEMDQSSTVQQMTKFSQAAVSGGAKASNVHRNDSRGGSTPSEDSSSPRS